MVTPRSASIRAYSTREPDSVDSAADAVRVQLDQTGQDERAAGVQPLLAPQAGGQRRDPAVPDLDVQCGKAPVGKEHLTVLDDPRITR